MRHAEFDEFPLLRNARPVHDLEFRLPEGRRDLVFHDLDAGEIAGHFLAVLDGTDAPDVHTDRRVEFQRIAAGGGFGIAEHDADLHANLVDEDHDGIGTLDVARQLAQRLGHQARLQAHVRIAHLALDLGLRRERGDRVDHHHVDRARAHQHVGDLQRLFAGVGLGHQQVIDLDSQLFRVHGIERMLGVHECGGAAVGLCRGDDRESERRLSGGLRPEDFDHAAARNAAHAKRDIETKRAGGNGLHFIGGARIAQAHHGALSKLFFDLAQRGRQSLLTILFHRESSTMGGAIISYSAPAAHLISTDLREFFSGRAAAIQ